MAPAPAQRGNHLLSPRLHKGARDPEQIAAETGYCTHTLRRWHTRGFPRVPERLKSAMDMTHGGGVGIHMSLSTLLRVLPSPR
jgi:hypothetical protein